MAFESILIDMVAPAASYLSIEKFFCESQMPAAFYFTSEPYSVNRTALGLKAKMLLIFSSTCVTLRKYGKCMVELDSLSRDPYAGKRVLISHKISIFVYNENGFFEAIKIVGTFSLLAMKWRH